ncbi:hypothetical protein M422DRAFT_239104 [Sphaerobolus stellatus SS14]|nr:hypothetical protein M422DRAFT_239104 [Sphaerobolus stellatus SS14]
MQMLAWPLEEDKEGKGWVVRKDKDMEMLCSQLMVSWLDSWSHIGIEDSQTPKSFLQEYNVHFLSTSDIAPSLEVLDGIVDQLEEAQDKGVWAWDCENKSLVPAVPCIFALLGDNPMQSEMARQPGLMAKFLCWICIVKGHDNADKEKEVSPLHPN